MPPKSDPRREEALRLYLDSKGKKSLHQIAEELGISKSTVGSWSSRDHWKVKLKQNGRKRRLQTEPAKDRKKSGYFGNTNAAGVRADVSAFEGNKNALKHGRYEEIKYDTMTDEERELMQASTEELTPIDLQIRLIKEIEVREYRMMQRIALLKAEGASNGDGFVADSATIESKSSKDGKEVGGVKASRRRVSSISRIQEIETQLTFVQRQKQAAILALHKLMQDQTAVEMEREKLQIQQDRLKIDQRRLALDDPSVESDSLAQARKLLNGIPDAFGGDS